MKERESTEVLMGPAWPAGQKIRVSDRATISLAEAATILGVHRTTAWSLHKRGEFPVPVLRVGSNLRVVKAHLQLFLDTGQPVTLGDSSPNQ